MKTFEIIITGRVQKVGFRACAKKIASDLNVTGTVMNLADGKVQIYATAEPIILEKFVSMLYSCPRAVIRDIRTTEILPRTYAEFSIIKSDGRVSTLL
ncbi:acylphosphatase [Methanoregula sp.]|uniref:acylphosphatase n=1 Tax=Methanoregula sp. TaxID=2052170 RepID=UPI002B94FBD2|nr:acylphosphatase [Methanoregula sp.]HVP96680.1 acylphosphatase [Methanoregula sp.]